MEFVKKVLNMDETVNQLTNALEGFAKKIEIEKLRAVGERNKVETESENRKMKIMELNNLLNEKKLEFERYKIELESLVKVESE